MRLLLILFGVLGLLDQTRAQTQLLYLDQRPKVIVNTNDTLDFPWTGGFNSMMPIEIEMNGDTLMDLLMFDRIGNRISTFLNDGSGSTSAYHYHPEYIDKFPVFNDWVRSFDYDCDGDLDLFSYTNNAMGFWRNDYAIGVGLQFVQVSSSLNSWYGTFFTNIFVTQVNLPALYDIDGDGDMDVLTFANSSNYLEYHRNYAMDSLGTCGDFLFYLEPYCWGYFKLSGLTNIGLLNQNCRSAIVDDNLVNRNRHSGSVLTPLDQDCDGDVDLLNGDILGQNMLFLLNGGTSDSAVIVSQDSAFPVYDVPVDLQNLPGAYYLDMDNDGVNDMFVSPFATVGEDYNNMLFYKNTTNNCTNVFDFIKSRFLSDETIDVGTAANVSFFDVDKDGLLDIIAGNDFYYHPNPNLAYSRLAFFKNIGTVTQPMFSLVTDDWLSLSSITQYGLYPSFGDLDGDGDDDLLLGNADGTLIYYSNTAGVGLPCNFVFASPQYQGIDIGNNSTPQIVDVNRDGKNDLLIGERSGTINYFENLGTSISPVFLTNNSNFGNVNVLFPGAIAGFSTPLLFDNNGVYEMLVGSDNGTIFHCTNIDGNLMGSFTIVDSSYQNILELKRITLAKGDIDGDGKFDLLTGCNSGGMRLYTQYTSVGIPNASSVSSLDINLSPNPTSDFCLLNIQSVSANSKFQVFISDVSGRILFSSTTLQKQMQLNTSTLSSGIYILQVSTNGYVTSKKLCIQR
ncbi:MAG: VCBS repeat-containing protein [Bacteroidetes bacterium]|nr:VCBS repeat-containing protein [Bacteroidota bacterium]